MILHIEFTDGSNPYVCYGDKDTVQRKWNRYKKIEEARPLFMGNGLKCRRISGGGWAIAKYFDGACKYESYKKLGNALNRLCEEN